MKPMKFKTLNFSKFFVQCLNLRLLSLQKIYGYYISTHLVEILSPKFKHAKHQRDKDSDFS